MIGAWIKINKSVHIEGEKSQLGSTREQSYN